MLIPNLSFTFLNLREQIYIKRLQAYLSSSIVDQIIAIVLSKKMEFLSGLKKAYETIETELNKSLGTNEEEENVNPRSKVSKGLSDEVTAVSEPEKRGNEDSEKNVVRRYSIAFSVKDFVSEGRSY